MIRPFDLMRCGTTMIFKSTAWRIAYGILVAGFLSFIGWLTLRDTSTQLYNRINGAVLNYNVTRQVILHPGQCVSVGWNVEGIENVFFDDQPAVGQQVVSYCPYRANLPDPTLYIDFQGNFIQEFTVPITILTEQSWFWMSLVSVLILGVLTFVPLPTRNIIPAAVDSQRRRLLVGIGVTALIALVGAAGVQTTARIPEIVITDGWVLRENEVRSS
jgi:hypothetical protein